MFLRKSVSIAFVMILSVMCVRAQKAEIAISLNEGFFDALLDSVFQNFDPPEFPIGIAAMENDKLNKGTATIAGSNFIRTSFGTPSAAEKYDNCSTSIKIVREMSGIRTAVRFREGKVYVPLAFTGGYLVPFLGCIEYAGWAEANIALEFDAASQKLLGRIQVFRVNLNGGSGVGSASIAKLVQGSIDKKMNPIEILALDRLTFTVPVQGSGALRMRAVSARPEIANTVLNVYVGYEFSKG